MKSLFLSILMVLSVGVFAQNVSGELKKWHRVTVDFEGPSSSEDASNNPFLNYRLDVTFTNGSTSITVPGFFAADGNAGETGASSGNVWRAHFCPSKTGTWTYKADFRKGTNVSIADNPSTFGTDASIHGKTGTFNVAETDKVGRDMRAKGRLEYVNGHHLKFAGTGEYYMKVGADSPENLLAYYDIDNTGGNSGLMKDWAPHVKDWNNGDPTWKNGKGKGLIGALNYLAEEKMNSISFLTMNSPIGDDKNVFPWIDKNKQIQYDCSKLDQWEIVFSHAQEIGLFLHFKTQETENELILDNGAVGTERKLYYRELVARFAHHNALEWNLCEEGGADFSNTNQTMEQRRQSIAHLAGLDPYKSNVVIHTGPGLNAQKKIYNNFLGNDSKLTGVSLQKHWDDVFECTHHWIEESAKAGRKWVVASDEQGGAQVGVPHDDYTGTPNKDGIRKQTLWGNMMAGGAGVMYYFGYGGNVDGQKVDILFNSSDMRCQDFRTRDISWDYARYALEFFDLYIPFWEMHNDDSKTSNANSHCLMKNNEVYVVYLQNGGSTNVTLGTGTYNVDWFNPRTGGALQEGTRNLAGGGSKGITAPSSGDWVALVRNTNFSHNPQVGNGAIKPNPDIVASVSLDESLIVLKSVGDIAKLQATVIPASALNKTLKWESDDENVATVSADGTITAKGNGRAVITVTSTDGTNKSASAEVVVGVSSCREYTYGPNWVVFEPQVTNSNLDLWVERKPGDHKYMEGTRRLKPIGDDYLEFTGNDENGGTAKSPLIYKFTAPTTAKYTMAMRMLQNLEGAEWDKSNDVWVKLEGDFTSANAFSTDQIKENHKFYGRGKDNWGSGVKMEGHVNNTKTHATFQVNLKQGEEYTFTMSGRAERTCIDYIIFFESSLGLKFGEEVDIASENDEKYLPQGCDGPVPTCETIYARDFDKLTVSGYDPANLAKVPNSPADAVHVGEMVLGCGGTNGLTKPCAAEETFAGADGNYFITVNAMGEPDGECTYEVFVNGTKVGEKQTTRIHGTNTPAYTIEPLQVTNSAVAIKKGDVIRVTFNQTSNNLVEEGEGYATARGRWMSIELCTDGNTVIPVIGIKPLPATQTVETGATLTLSTSVEPSNASNQKIIWTSSNKAVATVNASGVVTGVSKGTVTITATSSNGGFETSTTVTVKQSTSVTLSPIHDAYLENGTLKNTVDLRVENGRRVTYLMFDLGANASSVAALELQLTPGSDAGNGTITVANGSHNNWTETNLSSTNAPAAGKALGTSTGALAIGTTYKYNVSDATITDGKVTFVVTMASGGNDVSFGSKENATAGNRPVLKVTLKEESDPSNADLATLSVSEGAMSPAFSSTTASYFVTLPAGTTVVPTVSATADASAAAVKITQATAVDGSATVVVTAEDGSKQTYTVNFSIGLSDDATLASISASKGSLSPAFDPAVKTYVVKLPAGTTTVPTITAKASDADATIAITDADNLNGKALIDVTSASGETDQYTITFEVTDSNVKVVYLKEGWNLVGCPIEGSTAVETALSSIWDNVEIVKDFDGFYKSDQDPAFNSLKEVKWGRGYFVKVSADCELTW